jgi:hypothetical protein
MRKAGERSPAFLPLAGRARTLENKQGMMPMLFDAAGSIFSPNFSA